MYTQNYIEKYLRSSCWAEVSVENGFLFLVNPKSGSTSVRKFLHTYFRGVYTQRIQDLISYELRKGEIFTFGISRNPWDRTISNYLFMKENHLLFPKEISEMNFDDFIKKIEESLNGQIEDLPENARKSINKNERFLGHVIPQSKILLRKDFPADKICRFESLVEEWNLIGEKIGIRKELPMKNKTLSKGSNYQKYYSDKGIQLVRDIYREDVMAFGYEF